MTLKTLALGLVGFALHALVSTPAAAEDENFENVVSNFGKAIVIEMPKPKSPKKRARKLQEAWVRMSYVVSPDGRAIDPIVIDSSGGIDFENELRKATELWSFEVSDQGAELPLNTAQVKFTILGRGKGTTRTFARHARHIMKALHNENPVKARENADSAVRLAGWNLYESTILWLMLGRVAGAEENFSEQLEMYKRGLAVSSAKSLRRDARADLLEDIINLQNRFGHYAGALRSFETLKKVRDSEETVETVTPLVDEIREKMATQDVLTAQATIANPCDCEGGKPLWHYEPQRRTFTFENIEGNVTSFEARCERQRIKGDVSTGTEWELPEDWGYCQVFVFGDDGATFDFLSHLNSSATEANEAVARR